MLKKYEGKKKINMLKIKRKNILKKSPNLCCVKYENKGTEQNYPPADEPLREDELQREGERI